MKGSEDFYMKTKVSVYDCDTMIVSGTSYYLWVMDYYKVAIISTLLKYINYICPGVFRPGAKDLGRKELWHSAATAGAQQKIKVLFKLTKLEKAPISLIQFYQIYQQQPQEREGEKIETLIWIDII